MGMSIDIGTSTRLFREWSNLVVQLTANLSPYRSSSFFKFSCCIH